MQLVDFRYTILLLLLHLYWSKFNAQGWTAANESPNGFEV